MKIVIQNTKTGELYEGNQKWSRSWETAIAYTSVIQAYEAVTREQLEDVLIVMGLGKPELDVHLPVG